jgi:chemotaxis protein MotB
MKVYPFLFAIGILMSSCVVSKKKYKEQVAKNMGLTADKAICNDSLLASIKKSKICDSNLTEASKHLNNLFKDSAKTHSTLDKLNKLYSVEAEKNEKLNKDYKDLLNNSSAEAGKLNSDRARKQSKQT